MCVCACVCVRVCACARACAHARVCVCVCVCVCLSLYIYIMIYISLRIFEDYFYASLEVVFPPAGNERLVRNSLKSHTADSTNRQHRQVPQPNTTTTATTTTTTTTTTASDEAAGTRQKEARKQTAESVIKCFSSPVYELLTRQSATRPDRGTRAWLPPQAQTPLSGSETGTQEQT